MELERREALVAWVNSFPSLSRRCENLNELWDGVQLGEALCQMIPNEINEQYIKKDFGDNAIMRTNNIKRIVTAAHNFLTKSGIRFNLQARVDPQAIGKDRNEKQLETLVHALLGIAIECDNKSDYINIIMNLSEECQKHLMLLIESVLNSNYETVPSSEPPTTDHSEEITLLSTQNTELKKRVSELTEQRQQIAEQSYQISDNLERVKKQKKSLKDEKKMLTAKVVELQMAIDQSQQKEEELQKNLRSLQVSLQNKDSDTRSMTMELQQELSLREEAISKCKKKIQELEKENVLVHELRERVEVLLDVQAESEQDKRRLQRLREKMEEFKDLRTRYATLEQKYDAIMKQNSDYTFQIQQQKQNIQNLSEYKEQYANMNSQLVQMEVDLSVKENRLKELEDQLQVQQKQNSSLQQSNQVLEQRTKHLSSLLEDKEELDGHDDSFGISMEEPFTPELKEKMKQLEMENENLRRQVESTQESTEVSNKLERSESMQMVLQQTVETLKEELAQSKSKNAELSAALEASSQGASEEIVREFEHTIDDLTNRYDSLKQNHKTLQEEYASATDELTEIKKQDEELRNELENLRLQSESNVSENQEKNNTQLELQQELDTLKSKYSSTHEELQQIRERLQETVANRDALLEEKKAKTEDTTQNDQIAQLQSEIEACRKQLEESENEKLLAKQNHSKLAKLQRETKTELQNVKARLETAEIECEELAKALEANPEIPRTGKCEKCCNLQTQIDMLDSSLSALGLRYGGRTTINAANAIERLSLLGKKRSSASITF